MEAIRFIVDSLLQLFILAFVLRFLLQLVRANFYNPISQAILRITDPLVVPARRVIPGWKGLDIATLVVILLLELAATQVLFGLYGMGFVGIGPLFAAAIVKLVRTVIQVYFFALLIYALLSWLGPQGHHPAVGLLSSLCEPLLRPVRRIIPPIGGLDLSVLFLLLGLQALLLLFR